MGSSERPRAAVRTCFFTLAMCIHRPTSCSQANAWSSNSKITPAMAIKCKPCACACSGQTAQIPMMRLRLDSRIRKYLCVEDRHLLEHTLAELVEEDLGDVATALCERAMPPNCRLARVVDLPDELTDFMRLLLLELQSIARAPGWSGRLRRERAEAAMTLCGFSKELE